MSADTWTVGICLVLLALVVTPSRASARRRVRASVTRGDVGVRAKARPLPRLWSPATSRRREEERRRADVQRLLSAFGAELRAGQSPRDALREAASGASSHACPAALAACALGSGVAAALRQDARAPGSGALRGLAACWQVGELSGARFAEAVDQLIERARRDIDVRRQLGSELAGPRATARLVGGLPILGLAIGYVLGANPVAWLIGTPLGSAVFALGVTLDVLGLWWMSRLVATVETQLSC